MCFGVDLGALVYVKSTIQRYALGTVDLRVHRVRILAI